MYLVDIATNYLWDKFYPFTIVHVIGVLIITVISYYIMEFFLGFKLVRWIYIGTLIVIAASMYRDGNEKELVRDAFKLATI